MADLQQLEESIVGLSLLEAAQLVKKLEERLGVSAAAAAPVVMAGGSGAAAGAGGTSGGPAGTLGHEEGGRSQGGHRPLLQHAR